MESMVPIGGQSSGCSSLLGSLGCGKALGLIFSTLRPASNESIESTSPDELLDLISELDAFFCVMAVVAMVEIELIGVVLFGVYAHPL